MMKMLINSFLLAGYNHPCQTIAEREKFDIDEYLKISYWLPI